MPFTSSFSFTSVLQLNPHASVASFLITQLAFRSSSLTSLSNCLKVFILIIFTIIFIGFYANSENLAS
jgi:hypothetical protein